MNSISSIWKVVTIFAVTALISACSSISENKLDTADNIFEEAVFIKATPRGEGAMAVSITNPWDTTGTLANYLLANTSATSVAATNEILLQLPLKRLIVYSSVHAALIAELGYADAIVGVADADYIKTPEILLRLAEGRITDIGSSLEPSLEKIIAAKPDAVLLSPFQNAGHGVVDKAGIPVIECADYMETTPLGRAEWSKFYAMLVEGIAPTNNRTFDNSRAQYNQLKETAQAFTEKPKVVTEWQSNGNWMMPGGASYAGRLLTDAGATYPFAGNTSPGSIPMNYEKAFMAAKDADFWLIKSFDHELTLNDVAKNHPLNKRIWAYNNNGIYYANTARANLFEETPFHPERLLAEYIAIFHKTGAPLRYYQPIFQ